MNLVLRQLKALSLIELMVTLSLILIVTIVAVPATNKYITQSRVADALSSVADLQSKITLQIAQNESVTDSGLNFTQPTTLSRYVDSFIVSNNGVISITTTADAGGVTLNISPVYSSASNEVSWTCQVSSSALNDYVPRSCRAP